MPLKGADSRFAFVKITSALSGLSQKQCVILSSRGFPIRHSISSVPKQVSRHDLAASKSLARPSHGITRNLGEPWKNRSVSLKQAAKREILTSVNILLNVLGQCASHCLFRALRLELVAHRVGASRVQGPLERVILPCFRPLATRTFNDKNRQRNDKSGMVDIHPNM